MRIKFPQFLTFSLSLSLALVTNICFKLGEK